MKRTTQKKIEAQEVQKDSTRTETAKDEVAGKSISLPVDTNNSAEDSANKEKTQPTADAWQKSDDEITAGDAINMTETAQKASGQQVQTTAQNVQEDTPQAIWQRINMIASNMDYMKDPEGTKFKKAAQSDSLKELMEWADVCREMLSRYADILEKETGADPEQAKDPEAWTEEQTALLAELSLKERIARFKAFSNTNYMQAAEALEPIKGKCTDPELVDDYTTKKYAVLYFFALHYPDIKPQHERELTSEQIVEVRGIFKRLDAFYYEQTNGGETERDKDLFAEFVRKDNSDPREILKLLPRTMSTPPDRLNYPTDKINNSVWEDLSTAHTNDNGQIAFATEKRGSNKEATVLYSIDFTELEKLDGLKLTRQLTAFDKRVYIAVSAIYAQGEQYMSAGQIFTAMGGVGKPTKTQLEKINDSLTKMGAAHVYINNRQEIAVNKGYPRFMYDAALLPFERVSAYINNALVSSSVHLLREPPLTTFARERKQITTVPRMLLAIPLNQTEDNLILEDYLIERIASMKKPGSKQSRKILFSTIYEKCKIDGKSAKDRKARSRIPEKIRKCLDHFKKQQGYTQGYIKGYKETKDGITIAL